MPHEVNRMEQRDARLSTWLLILPDGVQCDGHEQQDLDQNTEDDSHPKALPTKTFCGFTSP